MHLLQKCITKTFHVKTLCTNVLQPPWNILFFGTDNFSLASLRLLNEEFFSNNKLINRLEVVTSAKSHSVRKFSEEHKIVMHDWPLVLPKTKFDIGLVVSFGHLIPRNVIEYFPMGMLNVHASLLPRWRGAAPIIYAIAKGDTKTGITIMQIKPDKFDVGEIFRQEEISISEDIRLPELYSDLSSLGAKNLLKTLKELPDALKTGIPQSNTGVTLAPKISASMANADYTTMASKDVYNLSRALTGLYPLVIKWNEMVLKVHNISGYKIGLNYEFKPGTLLYDKQNKILKIYCKDGFITVDKISIPNKKVMTAIEFNNGYLKNISIKSTIVR